MARGSIALLLPLFILLFNIDLSDRANGESLTRVRRNTVTPCNPNPCQNGKSCTLEGKNYKCQCSSVLTTTSTITTGYKGVNCTEDIDECSNTPKPCFNGGACDNQPGTFRCACYAPFSGQYCGQRVQNCKNAQLKYNYTIDDVNSGKALCMNGANCTELSALPYFKCVCAPGFNGVRCEININECESDPCKNGAKCVDKIADYSCECKPGFTGKNCETNIDECKLYNACKNSAPCTDKINDYFCNCSDTGYQGKNCSVEINECDPKPCKNNANCTDALKDYNCSCYAGYQGKNCEVDVDECAPKPCKFESPCLQYSTQSLYGKKSIFPFNGTFSYDRAAGYACECVKGTQGRNCETNINDCSPDPCKNGATCVDKLADFQCNCKPGYTNKTCAVDINECASNPCKNGANCTDKINDYSCKCAPMNADGYIYEGKNCSEEIVACRNNKCQNGATCKTATTPVGGRNYTCTCLPGWTEWNCGVSTILSYNGTGVLTISSLNVATVAMELRVHFDPKDLTLALITLNDKLTIGLRNGHVVLNDKPPFNAPTIEQGSWLPLKVTAGGQLEAGVGTAAAKTSVAALLPANEKVTKVVIGKAATYNNVKMLPLRGCTRDLMLGSQKFLPSSVTLQAGVKEGCVVPPDPCRASPCQGAKSVCRSLWEEFRCDCEPGRGGTRCESKTGFQTFGFDNKLSYAVFGALPLPKQHLADTGILQFTAQLVTRASTNTKKQEELLFYYGVSKKTAATKGSKYVLVTITPEGLLQVFVTGRTEPILFPRPLLGDGFQENLQLTISDKVTLSVNGTIYSAGGTLAVNVKTQLVDADLFCVGGYKGLTMAELGPNFGIRVKRATTEEEQVPPAAVRTTYGLRGALSDVRAGPTIVKLGPNDTTTGAVPYLATAGVTTGIVSTDMCKKTPNPCKNGGVCSNMAFDSFNCNCTDGWRGQDCAFKDYCAAANVCPAGFTCSNVFRQDFYECSGALTYPNSSSPIIFEAATAPANLETVAFQLRTRATTAVRLLDAKNTAGAALATVEMNAGGNVVARANSKDATSSFKINNGQPVRVVVEFPDGAAPVVKQAANEAEFTATRDGSKKGLAGAKSITLFPNQKFEGCVLSVRANGYPFRLHNTAPAAASKEGGGPKWGPKATITHSLPPGKCNSLSVCAPNPCKNGAKCKDEWNRYSCDCGTELNGTNCEEIICPANKGPTPPHSLCLNGGMCVASSAEFMCKCALDYAGNRCKFRNECRSNPCENDGVCSLELPENQLTATSAEFKCACKEGWTGDKCSNAKAKSASVNYVLIFILIGVLLLVLIILLLFLVIRHVRASRATSGNYNPHNREMNGSNVYMSNVIKPPPGERLI